MDFDSSSCRDIYSHLGSNLRIYLVLILFSNIIYTIFAMSLSKKCLQNIYEHLRCSMCAWVVEKPLTSRYSLPKAMGAWDRVAWLNTNPSVSGSFVKKDAMFPHWIHVWYISLLYIYHFFYFMGNFKEKMMKRCKRIMDDDHVATEVGTAHQNTLEIQLHSTDSTKPTLDVTMFSFRFATHQFVKVKTIKQHNITCSFLIFFDEWK